MRRSGPLLPLALLFSVSVGAWSVAAQDAPDVTPDKESLARGTGYLPTPPELLAKFPQARIYRDFLPPLVDLSRHVPPPGYQGKQESCIGWAAGYAARGYYSSAVEGLPVTRAENVPSPSYIYNLALSQRRDKDCGSGMFFREAFRILKRGSVSLAQMPYEQSSCSPPSAALRKLANRFRIREWQHANPRRLDTIKGQLAKGHPVVFGMMPGEDFKRHRGDAVYSLSSSEIANSAMGHAMTAIGYDEARQAFRIINSWGPNWGDQGYAWIDYGTFRKSVREAYAMRPRSGDPAPPPKVEPKPQPPVPVTTVEDLGLECAKVTLVSEGGRQIAKGFVAKTEDLARVREKLKDRASEFELDVRPWPQCEALLTLDRSLSADDRPAVTIRGAPKTLKMGDSLVIDIVSPSSPSHLHVAYIQADGSVVHLVQSDAKNLQTVDSRQRLVFGDGIEGRQRFTVREPFGAEMIIALASRAPLFPEPRPQSETERDFLTALRRALLWKPDLSAPDRVVSAASLAIVTTEK